MSKSGVHSFFRQRTSSCTLFGHVACGIHLAWPGHHRPFLGTVCRWILLSCWGWSQSTKQTMFQPNQFQHTEMDRDGQVDKKTIDLPIYHPFFPSFYDILLIFQDIRQCLSHMPHGFPTVSYVSFVPEASLLRQFQLWDLGAVTDTARDSGGSEQRERREKGSGRAAPNETWPAWWFIPRIVNYHS